MPGRSQSRDRCPDCALYRPLCVCVEIAQTRAHLRDLVVRTAVTIVMHSREQRLTSGSARLAQSILPECEILVRGLPDAPLDLAERLPSDRPVAFLFPSDGARELTPALGRELCEAGAVLVVPDGSWRQAAKVGKREPALQRPNVRRITLPTMVPSAYRLRHESAPENVCTFEAIARALGQLERAGPAIRAEMEALFERRVERTLWSRGRLAAENCVGGIPREAFDRARAAGIRGGELSAERRRRIGPAGGGGPSSG